MIAVSSPSVSKHPGLRAALAQAFPHTTLRYFPWQDKHAEFTPEELILFCQGAQALIVGKEPVQKSLFIQCPELKVIAKYGVGMDQIDEDACRRYHVTLLTSPGANAPSVAEYTLGLMLNLVHGVHRTARMLKQGTWYRYGGQDLGGMQVGIVGLGHVGTRVAGLLGPLGAGLWVCDIVDKTHEIKHLKAHQLPLKELLPMVDLLTLHVPLTRTGESRTLGLLNGEALGLMKPGAFLVNTSRGEVIDEAALVLALQSGHLGGAALDVFAKEPLATDHPFMHMEQVLCTPHSAGASEQATWAMGMGAIHQLKRHYSITPNTF